MYEYANLYRTSKGITVLTPVVTVNTYYCRTHSPQVNTFKYCEIEGGMSCEAELEPRYHGMQVHNTWQESDSGFHTSVTFIYFGHCRGK